MSINHCDYGVYSPQSAATVSGGQERVVVKRLYSEDKDVRSNPTATEKRTLGDPPTEGSPIVQQDLSGRPAI